MNELSAFERRLAAGLEDYAGPRQRVDADAIARAAANRLPVRQSILHHFTAGVALAPRLAWRPSAVVVIVAVLTLALAAGVVIVGNQERRLPAVEPAGNGLLAYSSRGDIYVGDPETGETTAIVTGPDVDSAPLFSPDGTRIAFVRGDQWSEAASLVVVRTDGSDARTVVPAGFSQGGLGATWTPDGTSLLVNHHSPPHIAGFDGDLTLVDVSGAAEPRLVTPPLPNGPGGPYFHNTDPVAPIFRPPDGNLILTTTHSAVRPVGTTPLYAWDGRLTRRTTIEPVGLEDFEPYYLQPWALRWSPDGSRIAALLGWGEPRFDLAVMNADGSDARLLEGASDGPWSPDSTRIAFQSCRAHPDGDRSVIVIVDVSSGAMRELEVTDVATKYEGTVSPRPRDVSDYEPWCGWISDTDGRAWDYEGWSWSPDSRSIVMLERRGERPIVVDVETGQATDLPWEADSAPSWQRILPTGPG
jgi:Tol biopolymer transport system component